ncbi:SCO3242 family prenyltransferase [Solicola gregarius]|uniref:UbiA family prenyltransferase n=1 Tax=Solicola gregarius TaxID=2908642 RepID=A0AA46TM77_9ACTN|nr:UbiA family prenyltransferase [Solicola gregarius]UYM07487.1 UbiA family prenyltransferase [Solicola gregarius]
MNGRDLAELVRLPAALTVPGDALTGAAYAGASARYSAAMPIASACLYWAGMALNDWADRDLDAVERPERPIPSGRISPRTAITTAGVLGLAGISASAVAGGRAALRVSLPLAALVWAYDTIAKQSPAGPVVMASNRGLDVLLGACAAPVRAWEPATSVAAHTVAVTTLSRDEVHGTDPSRAGTVTAATAAIATAGVVRALTDRRARRRDRLVSAALSTAYGVVVGRAQSRTIADPSAATVRDATGRGIAGFPLLQASWLARRGRLGAAATVLAGGPLVRYASRRMSTT